MQKNIIYFSGSDTYGVDLSIDRWKRAFEGRYGSVNIDRYDLAAVDLYPQIRDQIVMSGLFSEKRLFIFFGGKEKVSQKNFRELIEPIAPMIPEDHFLMFHSLSKKEDDLILWLKKNADNRVHNDLWNVETWESRFADIDSWIIRKVLRTYEEGEKSKEDEKKNPYVSHDIWWTLKLIGLLDTDKQTPANIEELIHTEWGGKMFDLVDMIFAVNISGAVNLLRKISTSMKMREFTSLLIGLVRSGVYIKYLRELWLDASEIASTIKVHPFVLKKILASPVSYEKISRFYGALLESNKAYKSGRWLWENELWSIFSIELAIMGLKK